MIKKNLFAVKSSQTVTRTRAQNKRTHAHFSHYIDKTIPTGMTLTLELHNISTTWWCSFTFPGSCYASGGNARLAACFHARA